MRVCCAIVAQLVYSTASALQIAADDIAELSGVNGPLWHAVSGTGHNITASVPGDLISDLYSAGQIPYPFKDLTWREYAGLWDLDTWTYETTFTIPSMPPTKCANPSAFLVFEGVKLAADVILNGIPIGSVLNQHLRRTFAVTLLNGTNVLSVVFPPTVEDTRNDAGRFMGSSGGWDWAAYSNETTGRTPKGIRTFTKGIVADVYVARVCMGAITNVKALTVYQGSYPTAPLSDNTAAAWRVDVTVYVLASVTGFGNVSVTGAWDESRPVTARVVLTASVETSVTVSLFVPAGTVALWWPAGIPSRAQQTLYAINVTFSATGTDVVRARPQFVGFRTLALVTADDSSPSILAGVPGSGDLTMRLRVNGANLFARGANWIPLEGLEARNDARAQAAAVESAVGGSMNALRVWGGGVWPPDAFLDACDALGVLLIVDAMYASQADSHHFAVAGDPEQEAELRNAVRRIASHASVAIYTACNECGGSEPYSTFVAPTMAAEDPSRPIWPASPSAGWSDGVDRLWGTPLPGRNLTVFTANAPVKPVPGGSGCIQQAGAFAYGFPLTPFLDPVKVKDAAACCALCAASPRCQLANYESGGCQLVEPPFAVLSRHEAALVVFPAQSPSCPVPVPRSNSFEQHGPYYGGGGWPTVNGHGSPPAAYAPELPPSLTQCGGPSGTSVAGSFTSEFGVGQPASFESMSPTLSETFWGMHGGNHPADTCTKGWKHTCTGGNPMAQRNYGCDDAFATYYPGATVNVSLDDSGAVAFAGQLYLCQLATALKLKSVVEGHRATNIFGLLTWQLGEQWSTYGWGSLEYSSGEGSVLGGRWKPSHYMLARAFASVFAACGDDARCYIKNDDPIMPISGTVRTSLLRVRDGSVALLAVQNVSVPPGAAAIAWVCADGPAQQCNASVASAACSLTPDIDVQGVQGSSVNVADAAECCSACSADSECDVGVFYEGVCYKKPPGGERLNSTGRTLCAPGGKASCTSWATLLPAASCAATGTDCVLLTEVVDSSGTVIARNEQLLAVPGRLALPLPPTTVGATVGTQRPDGSIPITLLATGVGPALFVTLFTLAQGRFSDNVITLKPGAAAEVVIDFLPFEAGQADTLTASLRVNHLGQYMGGV